jgi:hypothetical protein
VAFFGGVYGSQPVGRELVLRLARHVAEGAKRNDVTVNRLLDRINIYFLPRIDSDGFEQVKDFFVSFNLQALGLEPLTHFADSQGQSRFRLSLLIT